MAKLSNRLRREIVARSLSVTRVVENRYVRELRGIMVGVEKHYRALGTSASPEEIDRLEEQVRRSLPGPVTRAFNRMAKDVQGSNDKALKAMGIVKERVVKPLRLDAKIPKTVGEISARSINEPRLAGEIQRAREANIELITKAARQYSQDVKDIFLDPRNVGLSEKDLVGKLLERGNVSKSRAELIARDQTLKLNSNITKIRQQAAGISKYTWATSNDERVREEHRELEGQTFSWDAPPAPGHPGEDFQCRCIAIPIVEAFDDDLFGELPPSAEEDFVNG